MAMVKVACVVVMLMAAVSAPMMVQAISCDEVKAKMLAPCLSYLKKGGAPSAGCCSGVKDVLVHAGTLVDKQTVCNCFQDAAVQNKIKDKYSQPLPRLCKVKKVAYKLGRSANCRKYVNLSMHLTHTFWNFYCSFPQMDS